ncbi:MAG: MFS transporter [Candidatus Altiarchaeota archaeon]
MHILKHRKLLHKKLLMLLAVTLLWLIADNALEFVFPTYLEDAGKSYFEIGLLLSIIAAGGILIDLPMGVLSDRASKKKLMISGLVLSVVASILLFSFNGNITLSIMFLIWGLAYQIWRVPRDALFASMTDKLERAEEYGLDTEVKYIGQTVGPVLAGAVLLYAGYSGIIGFYSILLISAVILILVYVKETKATPITSDISKSVKLSFITSELKELKSFGSFGFILLYFSLLFTAWEQILLTFEPLFYGPDVLGVPSNIGGLLLAFFSLPGIFLSYPAGKVADKVGKKTIMFIGLIVSGISLIAFSTTSDLSSVFFFALLTSIGWVISLPALNGLIIDLSYKHRKGCIAGIWALFMDIGFVAGPIIGGVIAEVYGIRQTFLAIGVLFLLSSALLAATKTRRQD